MKTFKTLYFYECKKLFQKKMVWIATALFFAVIAAILINGLLGDVYVNDVKYTSHYKLLLFDRTQERSLTGRAVNQQLLEEMKQAYLEYETLSDSMGANPTDEQRRQLADAHMKINRPYKAIFDLVRKSINLTGNEVIDWKADENDFYQKRQERISQNQDTFRLTAAEKAYWQQKEALLERPFTYAYKSGYSMLINACYSISTFTLLLVAISLSGIFSDEHTLRTDQLLLTSRHGKHALYLAKLAAGCSFTLAVSLLMTALAFLLSLSIYGPDGFFAAIQLIRPDYSYPVSAGCFALISYGVLTISALTVSILVMFLSELLHSATATLALTIGAIILGLFVNIPEDYRILSQIWDMLPTNLVFAGNIYDIRLIPVFGRLFTAWQIMPIFYLLAGGLIAFAGKPLYQRYQVAGR